MYETDQSWKIGSRGEARCTVGSQRDSKHPIQYELHRFIDFLNLQYGDLKVALLQYGDSKVALLAALLCFWLKVGVATLRRSSL